MVFLSLAGCTSNGAAAPVDTKPVETSRPAEVTPKLTQSAAPKSNVPKIRDNWVVNEAAMDELGQPAKFGGDGDLTAVRAKACTDVLEQALQLGSVESPPGSSAIHELCGDQRTELGGLAAVGFTLHGDRETFAAVAAGLVNCGDADVGDCTERNEGCTRRMRHPSSPEQLW